MKLMKLMKPIKTIKNIAYMENNSCTRLKTQYIVTERPTKPKPNNFLSRKTFVSFGNKVVSITTWKNGKKVIELDSVHWNRTKTTSFYRNIFLNEPIQVTLQKIIDNIYLLTNIN